MASRARQVHGNAPGEFFVDDSCIDCGACRWIAPAVFDAARDTARVRRQPHDTDSRASALRALVSCPTGSIGAACKHGLRDAITSFPFRLHDRVYHCGFHSEKSFGAASYLLVRDRGNVLIDSPRFSRPLVKAIEDLGGADWMLLSHRDDVADHKRFQQHFGLRRVLHQADVTTETRSVEEVVDGSSDVHLAPDLMFIPTPGHTRGSACVLFEERCLFTGDHLAYDRNLGHLYAFRDACWYDWPTQIQSMERLVELRFAHVLPGHGAPLSTSYAEMRAQLDLCIDWMRAQR